MTARVPRPASLLCAAFLGLAACRPSGQRSPDTPSDLNGIQTAREGTQIFYHAFDERQLLTQEQMPPYLKKELPALLARRIWLDADEGALTEAHLWRSQPSLLYEFFLTQQDLPRDLERNGRTRSLAELPVKKLIGPNEGSDWTLLEQLSDNRVRFLLGIERLRAAGAGGSFGGMGRLLIRRYYSILDEMDVLLGLLDQAPDRPFTQAETRRWRGAVLKIAGVSQGLLNSMRTGKPDVFIKPETAPARISWGQREIDVLLPAYQARRLARHDRVDLIACFYRGAGKLSRKSAVVAEALRVLEIRLPPRPDQPATLRLEGNAAQPAAVLLAQQQGLLSVVKRTPFNWEQLPTLGFGESDLRKIEELDVRQRLRLENQVRDGFPQDLTPGEQDYFVAQAFKGMGREFAVPLDTPALSGAFTPGTTAKLEAGDGKNPPVSLGTGEVVELWEPSPSSPAYLYLRGMTPASALAVAWIEGAGGQWRFSAKPAASIPPKAGTPGTRTN